jgi:phosphatidylglycerol:prolipoprotein diacylglycerol transferase
VHPIAFKLGPLEVHWYGVFVAAGFLAGLWSARKRAARQGISADTIVDLSFWILVAALVGARTLYVITFWRDEFEGKPISAIFLQRSGLVFYGGLIGAVLVAIVYLWRKKLPTWKIGDAMAPSIALGHAFGRLGCLMTGCCYGRACELPWAIHFPEGHATHGTGVHPVQLYESLLNFALWAWLEWFYRRKKFDGQIFASYLLVYAVLRAVVEMFRGDYAVRSAGGWITPGQTVSALILIAGGILYWRLSSARSTPVRR